MKISKEKPQSQSLTSMRMMSRCQNDVVMSSYERRFLDVDGYIISISI